MNASRLKLTAFNGDKGADMRFIDRISDEAWERFENIAVIASAVALMVMAAIAFIVTRGI
mgnify:CR=1 FL=1